MSKLDMDSVILDFDSVRSVYSGKLGCCCGCLGKHTYKAANVEESGKRRGYSIQPNEVNDRIVKRHINKINLLVALGYETNNNGIDPIEVQYQPGVYLSVQNQYRHWIAYFK